MLRKSVTVAVVAAFAATAAPELAIMPAQAAMPYAGPQAIDLPTNIEQAAVWVYVPGKHGKRYKKKYPGYGYYYGGYWYKRPWWKAGPGWVYVPSKHGYRYKAKRAGYGYYYGGYWYRKPWWKY